MKATKPFKNVVALKRAIKDGMIKFVIEVSLDELYNCGGIDGLNDIAEEFLLDTVSGAYISDISYRIVGCKRATRLNEGSVFVRVCASTTEFELEENESED